MMQRRSVLTATTAGVVLVVTRAVQAAFGNPDEPPQGVVNTRGNPASAADPGPQGSALAGRFPSAFTPPATDVSDMPMFWASFNNAPRRVQNGGWARQVTQADIAIWDTISGVDMQLTSGGAREMHWHLAAKWGFMSYGHCRITILDAAGRPYVADVRAGDLWYFPSVLPHSIQGDRVGRLRIHPVLRRRQRHQVQHPAADRLAHAYAAGDSRREFWRIGRDFADIRYTTCTSSRAGFPVARPLTGPRSPPARNPRPSRSPSRWARRLGYVKRSNGRYVKNVGNTDLQFLEVFRSPRFEQVLLSDWLAHTVGTRRAASRGFGSDRQTVPARQSGHHARIVGGGTESPAAGTVKAGP